MNGDISPLAKSPRSIWFLEGFGCGGPQLTISAVGGERGPAACGVELSAASCNRAKRALWTLATTKGRAETPVRTIHTCSMPIRAKLLRLRSDPPWEQRIGVRPRWLRSREFKGLLGAASFCDGPVVHDISTRQITCHPTTSKDRHLAAIDGDHSFRVVPLTRSPVLPDRPLAAACMLHHAPGSGPGTSQ